jgi:hypothetical protein
LAVLIASPLDGADALADDVLAAGELVLELELLLLPHAAMNRAALISATRPPARKVRFL